MTVPRYYLDRTGDARPIPGYILVETDTDYLRSVRGEAQLHVRGKNLCEWAAQLAEARGWEIAFVSSPTQTFTDAIPGLTVPQALELLDELGPRFDDLPKPVTAAALLSALTPAEIWYEAPSLEHASSWLVWLTEDDAKDREPTQAILPLLKAQSENWLRACDDALRPAYSVSDNRAAVKLLRRWFQLDPGPNPFPRAFPNPVPHRWLLEARETWQLAAVQTNGTFYPEIARSELPSELHEAAAGAAYTYYCANPRDMDLLDPQTRARLRSRLSPEETANLARLRPPATPSLLPGTLPEVLRWFETDYLPYRQWQAEHGDEVASQLIAQIATEYACKLLQAYPSAMHSTGSADYECLSISKARQLRENKEGVATFWIILDGMLYSDAETLANLVEVEPRLTRRAFRPVVSPLPTITRFCKPALMNGAAHNALTEDPDPVPTFDGAELLPRNNDPAIALAKAEPGKVYVWSLLEPDASYHQRGTDRTTIVRNVNGELQKVATAIKAAASAVPNGVRLRIILSTDHGRLLSPADRTHLVPPNMESHGRAAYGKSDKVPSREGFVIENATSTLFGSRFDLPCDVTIPLDGNAFRQNNDAGGREQFSHGGLFPEETIVPWVEIARDSITPKVLVSVRGKANVGARGTLNISIQNASTVPVILRSLTVRPGNQIPVTLDYRSEIRGQITHEEEAEIDRWFRSADAERATATARFEQIDGAAFDVEADVELRSIEMYRRDNLLEDL